MRRTPPTLLGESHQCPGGVDTPTQYVQYSCLVQLGPEMAKSRSRCCYGHFAVPAVEMKGELLAVVQKEEWGACFYVAERFRET